MSVDDNASAYDDNDGTEEKAEEEGEHGEDEDGSEENAENAEEDADKFEADGGEDGHDNAADEHAQNDGSSKEGHGLSGAANEMDVSAEKDEPPPPEDSGEKEERAADESAEANAAPTGADGENGAALPQQQSSDDASAPKDAAESAEPVKRSLGDTLDDIRRQLQEITDYREDGPTEDTSAADKPADAELGYVEEGAEKDSDKEAYGAANEEQLEQMQSLRIAEDATENVVAEPHAEAPADSAAPRLEGNVLNVDDMGAQPDAGPRPAGELRDDPMDVDSAERADALAPERGTIPPEQNLDSTQLEDLTLRWKAGDDTDLTSEHVWRLYETLTQELSYSLTEQLRLILEPTLATRLRGDYRSGKRLNMKKIIPYIASEFTKDKIWLRRTRASQREYQVLIAIDDSESMAKSRSVHLAFESLALITRALSRLEVGGVAVCKFGEQMNLLHAFEAGALSDDAGARIIEQFTFKQRRTDVLQLVSSSLDYLARARQAQASTTAAELWQLQIIISDGQCDDHDHLRALLRRAAEEKVMFVFVVIDRDEASSILDMQIISQKNPADFSLARYMDSFPFDFFVVLRDKEALPDILSTTLRQFFEKVSSDY